MSNSGDGSGAESFGHEGLLPPNQLLALRALLAGKTQGDAAEAAGVCRNTVGNWLQDPDFLAVYNRRRKAMQERVDRWAWSRQDKIFDALDAGLERGDPWLALKVAEKMGMYNGERPEVGPTDPTKIRLKEALENVLEEELAHVLYLTVLLTTLVGQTEQQQLPDLVEQLRSNNGRASADRNARNAEEAQGFQLKLDPEQRRGLEELIEMLNESDHREDD